MPKTLTQVYMQLSLTLLGRHIKTTDPQYQYITTPIYMDSFSDIPAPYSADFQCLSRLAFEQFEQEKIVFYSDSVPKGLVHFGFLDSVPALYCGGGVSYNFLHLTLQEFLAAYHITQLPNGIDVFKRHSEDRRWEVVWRFVSGLTGFQYFVDNVRCDAFVSVFKDDECLLTKNLLLHCLFESQLVFDYTAALERNKLVSNQHGSSPLDRYAVGYCIANCSSTTSWKVHNMEMGSGESFLWGLNSNHSGNGIIGHLSFSVFPTCLDSYPSNILSGIQHLSTNAEGDMLERVLPKMKNLTSLHIYNLERPVLLDAISLTNVTALTFKVDKLLSDQAFQSSLYGLVNSPSNKLKDLTISFDRNNLSIKPPTIKPLCDILLEPSSLNHLALLELPNFTDDCFDLLETNICLTNLHISTRIKTRSLQLLTKILLNNKTIEYLRWGCSSALKDETFLTKQVDSLSMALSSNTTLKALTLGVLKSRHDSFALSKLKRDSRVKLL